MNPTLDFIIQALCVLSAFAIVAFIAYHEGYSKANDRSRNSLKSCCQKCLAARGFSLSRASNPDRVKPDPILWN